MQLSNQKLRSHGTLLLEETTQELVTMKTLITTLLPIKISKEELQTILSYSLDKTIR